MSIRNVLAGLLVAGLVMAQGPVKQPGQISPPIGQPKAPTGQASAPAGQLNPPEGQVDPGDIIFRQENVFVMAPVIVHDGQGNIVNGLSPLDFELYDNGKLQKITEDATTHPISMVVAVQSSANMLKLLPDIQKIGSLFSGLVLGDNGELAVLSFDHRIQTMTDFTSDPDKISNAFKAIKIGSTPNHVNDAAMKGVNMLRTRDKARRRILLLISETRDNGSQMTVRDVLTEAEFKDITVYAVEVSHLLTSLTSQHEPPRPNAIPPEARHLPAGIIGTQTTDAQQNMGDYSPIIKEIFTAVKAIFISNPQEVYTKYTGGREYSYMTQKGLQKAIADIGDEIHSQYLLTYLPNNPEDAGYHEIEVRVLKPGLKVTTRPGYWSAAKPQ
jgi:VWFA-related protein